MSISFFEVFPDVLILLDRKGQIADYKAPLVSELYLVLEEWEGKSLQDLWPIQVSAAFERALQQVFWTQTPEQLEYSLSTGGEKAYYEARVIPYSQDRAIAIIRNITERQQRDEQLRHDAFHDGLTGLPNRNLFTDRLEMAMRRFRRFPKLYFAVFFIDLDSFKQVNDCYGHDVGDRLLKAVAGVLQSCVRANDTVARLGGDEFTILLDSITNVAEVRNVAERIQEKFRTPLDLADRELICGVSIGIVLSAFRYKQATDLVKDADTALYQSKQNGKGQYSIFEP
ncbi:diguanylate cyclase domain-containing protein [Altericista sp. CCNU0014]|uniref:diguanylate cyclase domain-containing protein n=1 Tax=Altericista sp. CCNU0014 TaxID=3082949 RepID=UPI00384CFB54